MADWPSLPAGTDVVVFADHLSGTDAVAKRLADFDAVVACASGRRSRGRCSSGCRGSGSW